MFDPPKPPPLNISPEEQKHIFHGLRLALKDEEAFNGYNETCKEIAKLIDKLVKYRTELETKCEK